MAEKITLGLSYLVVFRAYLASDGKTPATGKTIAITISKNGATSFGNPAAGATNATEMASGFYKFTLGAGDIDTAGPLAWRGAEGTINDAGDVLNVTEDDLIGDIVVSSGSTTSAVVASSISPASAVSNQFLGRVLIFKRATTTAALRQQAARILSFDHGTQTFNLQDPLTTAPVSGDMAKIL